MKEVSPEEQSFQAYRVIWYATQTDLETGMNGRVRYVLTEEETQDTRKRREVSSWEKIHVLLARGCVRVRTPEGNCGIRTASGVTGLTQAIRAGQATVYSLRASSSR